MLKKNWSWLIALLLATPVLAEQVMLSAKDHSTHDLGSRQPEPKKNMGAFAMFDIRNYGAKNDGKTDNTVMIQTAIDACAEAGGGCVLVAGGNYLTYTLFLRSGVRLEIEAGSVLTGGPDPLLYPEVPDNPFWLPGRCSRLNRRTLIYALNCDNIAIGGRGKINGNAQVFTHTDDKQYELHRVWKRKSDVLIPGRTLLIVGCRDVLLEDFSILDSAGWSMWLLDCDRICIERLKIDCDMRLPNVDGIHFSACRDATVSNCIIRSSDDAIVLRSHQEQLNQAKPCERIVVSNCTLESGSSAIRIGWCNDYLIRDCSFNNLVIRKSFVGISILIPKMQEVQFDPPRGPGMPHPPQNVLPFGVENLHFSNIIMETQASPFLINISDDAKVSRIRNIILSNVSARSTGYPFIHAKPAHHVSDITFDNVRFDIIPSHRDDLGAYQSYHSYVEFDAVENLQLNHVRFSTHAIGVND